MPPLRPSAACRLAALLLGATAMLGAGDAGAQSRAVKRGAKSLEAMSRGSLVGGLEHRRVEGDLGRRRATIARRRVARAAADTPRGRADRALTLDGALLRAIEIAPRQPERSARLLANARAYALEHGLALPGEVIDAIQGATGRFAARAVSEPTRAELDALTHPTGLRQPAMVAYARAYGAAMRRFNGARPFESVERMVATGNSAIQAATGRVSYWDVNPRDADTTVVGLGEASPFRTAAGKVRIFNHFLDAAREADLTRRYGEPSGSMEAEMTSSFRTVLVYPDGGVPYMLKFSGDWFTAKKDLEPAQIATSVERTLALRKNLDLVPEPAGLIVAARGGGKPTTVLYRPLPVPRSGRMPKGAALLAAHVLNAPDFAETPLGRKIFARHGSVAAWFERELAPKLAGVIHRSIHGSFTHLELHSQNIDVLVDADGAVHDVFVKDLLDMMHDPVLESASGVEPAGTAVLRDREWGNIGEVGTRYGVEGFHRQFLTQTNLPARDRGMTPFHHAVLRELRALGQRDVDPRWAQRYPEFHTAFRDTTRITLHDAIGAMRELAVKVGIEKNFRPDRRAKDEMFAGRGRATGSLPSANPLHFSSYTFGYVGKVPVAIQRLANGAVHNYYFRFE